MIRLALILCVVFALAPGTFVRSPPRLAQDDAYVTLTPIELTDPMQGHVEGELKLAAIWELSSGHDFFGGFSALTTEKGRRLISGSDRGWALSLPLDGGQPKAEAAHFGYFASPREARNDLIDIEALTLDSRSGNLWIAYENRNQIERIAGPLADDLQATADARQIVRPKSIAGWNPNSGPETLTLLDDGQFLMLSEGRESRSRPDHPALLFPDDPLSGRDPIRFRYAAPKGFDPVDAVQVPDGRVLILLRRLEVGLPLQWRSAIAIADPAEIEAGGIWSSEVVVRMERGILAENFEGIAFIAQPARGEGAGRIALISDNNFSALQRNLLVQLDWPGTP